MGELREYIEGIRFDSKWGRYDARQVDAFLEELLTRVDALSAELAAAKEKNAMFEKQSASMAAAMITAEKNCAAMLDDAKAEAEKIKAAAKQEGDDYVRSMYDRQSDMENEYREKKDALAAELAQLKSFKEKYHHASSGTPWSFYLRQRGWIPTRSGAKCPRNCAANTAWTTPMRAWTSTRS